MQINLLVIVVPRFRCCFLHILWNAYVYCNFASNLDKCWNLLSRALLFYFPFICNGVDEVIIATFNITNKWIYWSFWYFEFLDPRHHLWAVLTPIILAHTNVWCIKNRTKLTNVLLLCLVRFLMHQTLVAADTTSYKLLVISNLISKK